MANGRAYQDAAPHWHGVPEVVARGSPWEVGYAHGSQIPHRIGVCISNYRRLFLETANLDWAESRTRAEMYLPALEQNEPDLVEEMKGIAAGAGIDFLDILALNVRSEIALTNYSDGCTSIASKGTGPNTGVFLAQNWDWVGEASDSTAFFDIHKTGTPRMRLMGEGGIFGKFGFNDAGVGVCMNAIRSGSMDKARLPIHLALRRILECKSFDEAFEMLTRKGLASCVNIVIGDRRGNFATVECTPKGLAPIFPEPGTLNTFHTNHLWSPNIPAGVRDHPAKNSFNRLERIKELSLGQQVDVDKIRAWLSDEQGTPVSICRSAPAGAVGFERGETLATIIMDLTQPRLEVSFGRPSLSPPIRTIFLDSVLSEEHSG